MNSRENSSARPITAPRDPEVDTVESSRRSVTPSPDTVNLRDEDYPAVDQPLVAGSREARALHQNPPRRPDQLEAGGAGDAARPSKTGIMKPPLPPRGQMK
ncbi:hypothetical protein [Opitutus terrae]|uniref:Uncharacterized protein n=1 Tax=Opitutus terrae (strain DSM 11246 / JCM 15787 / PB90-1) TaxID=452637 RepID=B1ZNB7_OPITP|nr:hypothetical protein [Opitutus terrae]ACB73486.1 hypothetical protein Oter_0195 [Opitutus terrae PB90-1]